MEWDDGEVAPSPLQFVESWPRLKGRRQRFNPRRMEGQEEAQPPSSAMEPADGDPGQNGATTPTSNPANGATTPTSNPANGAITPARIQQTKPPPPLAIQHMGHRVSDILKMLLEDITRDLLKNVTRSGEIPVKISAVESRGGQNVSTQIRAVARPRGVSRREVEVGRVRWSIEGERVDAGRPLYSVVWPPAGMYKTCDRVA